MTQQDQKVLHDGNEMVLDALPFEPAPAGALEAVRGGGPTEAAFEQPLAPPSVPPARRAVRLRARQVEQLLVGITLEGPPLFGPRAVRAQRAGGAHPARGAVFVIATSGVIVVPPQDLARGAHKEVLLRRIQEALRWIDARRAVVVLLAAQVGQMRPDAAPGQGDEVGAVPVAAVGHRHVGGAPGVVATAVITPAASSIAR